MPEQEVMMDQLLTSDDVASDQGVTRDQADVRAYLDGTLLRWRLMGCILGSVQLPAHALLGVSAPSPILTPV